MADGSTYSGWLRAPSLARSNVFQSSVFASPIVNPIALGEPDTPTSVDRDWEDGTDRNEQDGSTRRVTE